MSDHSSWARRFVLGLAAIFLASGVGVVAPGPAHAEFDQVRLRYAGYLPATHVREIFTQKWMDEVTKRSGGRVKFDTFRDQALLGTLELLDGASRGISDFSYLATGYFPTELPLTTMLEMSYLSNNTQALMMTGAQMYKEFPAMRQEYEDSNLVLIGPMAVDPTIMASREPWKGIADIKGKRIRAFGIINQVLELLGAAPAALPAPEIYTAMERRIIDGYSGLPANLIPPWNLNEVSRYVIDYGAGTYAYAVIVMNKKKFDSLNQATQRLLTDTFEELLRDVYIKELTKLNHERTKILTDRGMQFIRWPKEEREEARRRVAERLWEDAIKTREARGVPARKFFERFRELMAKNEPLAKDYIDPVSISLGRPD